MHIYAAGFMTFNSILFVTVPENVILLSIVMVI